MKHTTTLVTFVGAAALLAGCAGTGTTPDASSKADDAPASSAASGTDAKDTDSGKTTIEFWSNHPGNSLELEKKIISDFEKENPDITVKLVDGGKNYEEVAQKFNAALAGGQVPDVVVASDVTWFNFALNDQLAPIGDLLEKVGGEPADYIANFYDEYTLDGNHYAVPYSRSTPLFYYNKDMWAKAGLPERGPKDWDEWNTDFAPKLKETLDAGVSPLVIPDGTNYMDWYFQGMIWSLGGAYSNEWTMAMGDDGSVKAGEFLKSQFEQGYFKAAKDATAPFLAGQTAAIMESTGSLGGLTKADKINFGTAFLPSPEGVEGCPTGGAGLAIPAKSKNQEAAAKFVAFATNTDNTNYFSKNTGYMPVRTSAIELPEVQKRMEEDPNYSTAIKQLPHTKKQDAGRVFVPGGGMRIGAGLDKIAQGADVTEVFSGIDAEQQKLIDSDIKPKLKN